MEAMVAGSPSPQGQPALRFLVLMFPSAHLGRGGEQILAAYRIDLLP